MTMNRLQWPVIDAGVTITLCVQIHLPTRILLPNKRRTDDVTTMWSDNKDDNGVGVAVMC